MIIGNQFSRRRVKELIRQNEKMKLRLKELEKLEELEELKKENGRLRFQVRMLGGKLRKLEDRG